METHIIVVSYTTWLFVVQSDKRAGSLSFSTPGPARAPARRRRELHGVRSGRTRPGPCLRLRERHLVPAAANRRPPEPVGSCQRRDRVHADAPSSEQSSHFEILTTRNATRDVASVAAPVTGSPELQACHQSLGEGGGAVDIRRPKHHNKDM